MTALLCGQNLRAGWQRQGRGQGQGQGQVWSSLPQRTPNYLWLSAVGRPPMGGKEASKPGASSTGVTDAGKQHSRGLSSRISQQVWILQQDPLPWHLPGHHGAWTGLLCVCWYPRGSREGPSSGRVSGVLGAPNTIAHRGHGIGSVAPVERTLGEHSSSS